MKKKKEHHLHGFKFTSRILLGNRGPKRGNSEEKEGREKSTFPEEESHWRLLNKSQAPPSQECRCAEEEEEEDVDEVIEQAKIRETAANKNLWRLDS